MDRPSIAIDYRPRSFAFCGGWWNRILMLMLTDHILRNELSFPIANCSGRN
jgi:hypothetical protein